MVKDLRPATQRRESRMRNSGSEIRLVPDIRTRIYSLPLAWNAVGADEKVVFRSPVHRFAKVHIAVLLYACIMLVVVIAAGIVERAWVPAAVCGGFFAWGAAVMIRALAARRYELYRQEDSLCLTELSLWQASRQIVVCGINDVQLLVPEIPSTAIMRGKRKDVYIAVWHISDAFLCVIGAGVDREEVVSKLGSLASRLDLANCVREGVASQCRLEFRAV